MRRALGIIARSVRDFFADGGVIFSASLSFFAITATVPLCLFLLTVFGYLMGEHTEFLAYFTDKLIGLFPEITTGITKELRNLITFKGIGKTSLVLYGFLSFQLYSAMHKAMEAVFKVKEERSLAGTLILSISVVTMLASLLMVSFMLTSALPLLRQIKPYFPWLRVKLITTVLVRFIIPLLLVQFAAMVIYVIVPKRRVGLTDAFWGGLFTAVMLEAAKHLFTWYMGSVIHLGTIYGSLSAFIMVLIWTYYSSAIFLVGGEIVHNLGISTNRQPRRRSQPAT